MGRIPKEDKAGLYLTVIFHLAVIIALLCAGLGASLKSEKGFLMDFSKVEQAEKMQAQAEKLQKEINFKEEVSRKLQKDLADPNLSGVRNVVVDRGALKDDRGTDAKQLYKDAERLQKELKAGNEIKDQDHADIAPLHPDKTVEKAQAQEAPQYSGPSVIAYSLEGRKASRLPIPAYRCMGAGKVTVIITVNPSGAVINAKIDENVSSADGCLRSFAVTAARMSVFSAKADASPKQAGTIEYQFIAQ